MGGYKKGIKILFDTSVSIFHSRLGLANAAKAAQRRPPLRGQRFLYLRQHPLPARKERVALRKIRKRQFRTRRVWRGFWRRVYWGFAALIFRQTCASTSSCSAGVRPFNGFETSCAAWYFPISVSSYKQLL